MNTSSERIMTGILPMATLPADNIAAILSNTMNLVDPRLIDHGMRVSGYVDRALSLLGDASAERRRDLGLLALVHDIGAYKTEEIDRIVHFETVRVWEHSVYGYLFLKYLTPLDELAPAVLFHHATCEELRHLHPSYHNMAHLLHIADRVDIIASSPGGLERKRFLNHFAPNRGIKYLSHLVDLYDEALFGGGEVPPPGEAFRGSSFTPEEQHEWLQSLPLSIDFRSPQTVTHTLGVAHIAQELAAMLGLSESTAERVRLGALLHDIGKQGIPPAILESPGRLSREEMEVMRTHVNLTEKVLRGHVDEDVLHIAIRHHEKINGGGYHRGLAGAELAVTERLVAVSDVLAALMGARSYKDPFPKEKVIAILRTMAMEAELDGGLVELALDGYDSIAEVMETVCAETVGLYQTINEEYDRLLARSRGFGEGEWVLDEEL